MRPVFEVRAITHRSDPIMRGTLLGKPVVEEHILGSILLSAEGMRIFEEFGPAGVTGINCPAGGDPYMGTIIQMRPHYVGHSRDVARFWLSSQLSASFKCVVVVDEDIDPFDMDQVWWAILTRVQGGRDLEVLPFGRASRSDPSIPRGQGEYTDRLIIDATKKLDYPYVKEWGGHWAPVCLPPPEVMELVGLKWRKHVRGEAVEESVILDKERELRDGVAKEWEAWRAENYHLSEEEAEKERARSYPVLTKMI